MSQKQCLYYESFDDEVVEDKIKEITIDDSYKYINNNIFHKIIEFIYYRMIMLPIALIYCKLIKHIKYENKKVLKEAKGKAYFVFANHTSSVSDAFSPSTISPFKKPYLIVNSKNLNVPFFKKSTNMLGAIPLPTEINGLKNFMKTIKYRIDKNSSIIIYPEARIWPHYTKIRPYKTTSFKYPIIHNTPSFVYTTTYQKTKKNKCKIVIYIDGPFYPNKELELKKQEIDLHDRIYNQMVLRSQNSNYEKYEYIKKEKIND